MRKQTPSARSIFAGNQARAEGDGMRFFLMARASMLRHNHLA
jgi:hypothetical protein